MNVVIEYITGVSRRFSNVVRMLSLPGQVIIETSDGRKFTIDSNNVLWVRRG